MSNHINFENSTVPQVTFKTRAQNANGEFEWKDVTSSEIFDNKKVVIFSLPGAFTPTCSSTHLPGYEAMFDKFQELGVSDVYCMSVNDTFVMNAWAKDQKLNKIKVLPDGNGEFTRKMGMLVEKSNLGFGMRSWRYSMFVDNGKVIKAFVEPGFGDNAGNDPFEVSDAYTMLEFVKGLK
jgi:peroxiredoxin